MWVRRIAFRGDAEWVGVLRPGRLDIYQAVLDGNDEPVASPLALQGPALFPALDLAKAPRTAQSVRRAVLALLRKSIQQARDLGVSEAWR
jgi:hypothetical protein